MQRISVFLTSAAISLLASCGSEAERRVAEAPAAPVSVQTARVARREWISIYEATGTVRARTTATVSARLMGYVREARAQSGDRVSAGQVLVVLDSRDLDSSLQRAEAAREEVKGAMPEAESAIAAAQAQLDLAQITFQRMNELFTKKSVTNQEFDESSARLKSAQAALAMARARRTQLDAKLAQVEQEVRAAGINRAYTEVTAPFDAVILTKSVEPGTLAVPGAPLYTLEGANAFRLEALVEESQLARIRTGQAVSVTLDGLDRTFNARVSEIVPSVDAASRAGTVKIDLPANPQLRSGLFGRAAFPQGKRTVVTVPAAAVVERGQLQSVFVVDGNAVRTRLVTLGARQRDAYEVLSGLSEGEAVVAPVPGTLVDGSPVEVQP